MVLRTVTLLAATTAERGFADQARCEVAEEETHCWEAARNDYEVGFYKTVMDVCQLEM